MLGSQEENSDRVWGVGCLAGINACENKTGWGMGVWEGRVGQVKKSNRDAGLAKSWSTISRAL